eukprot:gene21197-26074_t
MVLAYLPFGSYAKYPKAAECLTKDRSVLLSFYDFPAEHWVHLRTTNPIESVFATVRHRTVRSKGSLSTTTAMLMVFKCGHQVIEDDERKLEISRIFRNGRRRYDPASKERLVAACLEPGVSVSRLALEHGINAN